MAALAWETVAGEYRARQFTTYTYRVYYGEQRDAINNVTVQRQELEDGGYWIYRVWVDGRDVSGNLDSLQEAVDWVAEHVARLPEQFNQFGVKGADAGRWPSPVLLEQPEDGGRAGWPEACRSIPVRDARDCRAVRPSAGEP